MCTLDWTSQYPLISRSPDSYDLKKMTPDNAPSYPSVWPSDFNPRPIPTVSYELLIILFRVFFLGMVIILSLLPCSF
jgi:hypothetical protein